MNKKYISLVAVAGFLVSAMIAIPAFAETTGEGWGGMVRMQKPPGVLGAVSAINGNILTVTDTRTNTSYTVDASSATVTKNGSASTPSAVSVGDTVMVQGAVNGSSVTATMIRDGIVPQWRGAKGPKQGTGQNPLVQGNGQPVIGGNVTGLSGTTLTITNKSNVTYTIDASAAKITKMGTTTSITNILTGDNVIVQGTINGTSVTASSVTDSGSTANPAVSNGAPGQHVGFFKSIGNFFAHLFGF